MNGLALFLQITIHANFQFTNSFEKYPFVGFCYGFLVARFELCLD